MRATERPFRPCSHASLAALVAAFAFACTSSNAGDASPDADAALVVETGGFDAGFFDSTHHDARIDLHFGPLDDGYVDTAPPPDYGPPIIPDAGPLVMHDMGGGVLAHAELVTIDWSDFCCDAAAQSFGDFVPTSNWIHTVADEYGISLAGHAHYTIAGTTPATLTWNDLSALVDAGIAAGQWTANPGDTTAVPIWMFLIPPSTTIDTWPAAHDSVVLDGGHRVLAYAHGASSSVAELERAMSHELIEALTDPYVPSAPGLRGTGLFEAFSGLGEDEVADVCIGGVTEAGHTLTRSWSNASSLAGHSPCVPMAAGTFVGMQGPTAPVQGAPGTYFDVPLTAIADDPTVTFDIAVTVGLGDVTWPTLNRTRLMAGQTSLLRVNIPPEGGGPYYIRIDSSVGLTTLSTWPIAVLSF